MSSLSPLKEPVSFRKPSQRHLQVVPAKTAPTTSRKTQANAQLRKQAAVGSLTALSTSSQTNATQTNATLANAALASKGLPLEDGSESKGKHGAVAIETPLHELSNNALVLRCQNQTYRDRAAFEELVNRYQRYIDKLLYHLASDWSDRADLAQEIWIRVYRSIHRLKEPSKFKSWLGRITTNLFYDELRKRKRFKGSISLDAPRHSADGQYEWELPSDEPTPADTMMTREFHDHLKAAMAELPDVFQKTIEMRELQGLSYEEIANITGVSLGTVKSRIARARQRLQEKLNVYLTPGKAPAKKR